MRYFLIICLMVLFYSSANAATYYMGTTGADSGAGTERTAPWLTLQYSIAHISAGDTLIILDGTYTGSANSMDISHVPPTSVTSWTTIKAENVGGVTFDGENIRNMALIDYNGTATNCHWIFDGLIWARGSTTNFNVSYGSYIKVLRCGAYDVGAGNTVNFSFGYGSYNLFEQCYAWGSGRYKFIFYHCDKSIMRGCVARSDLVDTTGAPNPMAQFTIYSSTDSFMLSCISIDSDQYAHYNANEYNGIYVPVTSGDSTNNTIENVIQLNSRAAGLSLDTNNYYATNTTVRNSVFWDIYNGGTLAYTVHRIAGLNNALSHLTFGASETTTYMLNGYNGTGNTLKNSLVYGVSGADGTMFYTLSNDYNYYFDNTITTNNRNGAHDSTVTNYLWSIGNTTGGLKYLPRIETSSNISGLADDSGDIGANVTGYIGVYGSLYGDAGYNTSSGSMWPFPNEAIIKTKMAAYSNGDVSGARGFAASGTQLNGTDDITLTSYVWEYLGNQIPADIYGPPDTTPPTTSHNGQPRSATAQLITLEPNETATTAYCIGAAACTPNTAYTAPVNVKPGKFLCYRSTDSAGNAETAKCFNPLWPCQ